MHLIYTVCIVLDVWWLVSFLELMADQSMVQMLQIAAQAAQAASEAAESMRKMVEKDGSENKQKFSEASKVVRMPESFGSEDQDQDQKGWRDFLHNFKSWLYYADGSFEAGLTNVDQNPKGVLDLNAMEPSHKAKSVQLYAILSGLLKGKPLRVLRQQEDRNGLEVYRQLVQTFTPSSRTRSLSLLQALMQFPQFTKDRTLTEQILSLERLRSEYQKCSGQDVSDDLALSILVKCLPAAIRQHVQLQITDSHSYSDIKAFVQTYEMTTSTWSTARVHNELGVVGSASTSGPTPMEVDAVTWKGSGKGKFGKDGNRGKGKGKDKGKGKNSQFHGAYKGKGKGKDSSKGKSSSVGGGGKGYGQSQKLDPNQCLYCHGYGHRKFQCRKYLADKSAGNVRQVQDESESTAGGDSTAGASTVPTSAGVSSAGTGGNGANGGKQNVRKITSVTPFIHDLTALEEYTDASTGRVLHISMLQEVDSFDMTITDDDDCWTYSPSLHQVHHVRALSTFHAGEPVEILLDSGADASVLPLSCGDVGHSMAIDQSSHFVDAQGTPLGVTDKRVAELTLGNNIVIKEQFIVAPVTGPIVCLVKLLKAGWDFQRVDGVLHLCKDGHGFPLYYRKNSLYTQGVISKVSEVETNDKAVVVESVNAIRLTGLSGLVPGWNKLNDDVWALRSNSPQCVDTTLCPSAVLMWLRTTLVKYMHGWEVYEYAQPISELDSFEEPIPQRDSVLCVITIAHTYAVPAEFLGFEVDDGVLPSSQINLGIHDESLVEDVEIAVDHADEGGSREPPRASDGDEAPPSERVIEAPADGSVLVEGVRVGLDCTLKVIRAACESLGLSTRGSKRENMTRLQKFYEQQELLAMHSAATTLTAEGKRSVVMQKKPNKPTAQEVEAHNLTHEPYEPWCEVCVQFRARQDKHPTTDGTRSSSSLISFDFGFASRTADSPNKISFLACHDRDTGLVAALPALGKGGKFFQYFVTELTRFVVSTGYREVRMRCDSEPATLAILEATIKTCRILGIQVTGEPTAVGNHEANGGAERTVELVRSHANILVTSLESCCGADRQVFGCDHPIYSWALVHSAWLHNRFKVSQGQTPYERACGRVYSGRLAQFGERVMAYLRQEKKADPKWLPAIWLGKTLSNDCHVLCEKGVILVSRSIRRLPDGFNLEMLGSVESAPWDHGLTSLGHKLIQTKRQQGPGPLAAMPAAGTPDEAAEDPPAEGEMAMEGRGRDVGEPRSSSVLPLEVDRQDVVQGEIPAKAGMKPPPFNAVISGEVEMHGPSPSAPSHVDVPLTPIDQAGRDDLELEASERPAKQARTRDVMAVEEKHEDEMLEFYFQDAEVEMLEEYDETLIGHDFESYEASVLPDDGMKDLIFPYTPQEPELAVEEMSRLDIIADKIEVERLKDMGVLMSMDDDHIEEMKSLSTRFVRTWRDKMYDNNRVWLRRSRLVAREYSWLADRSDLFSPASNAISGRLLQLMFLRQREEGYLLSAIDVADAFLTVKQREKTKVTLDSGVFELGKVLPGQRAGSQWWYEDLTSVLCAELQMKQCEEYPNLLCNDDRTCMVLLHVDDMLVCGKKDYVFDKFGPTLQKHYKISASYLQDVGDELTFLKRTHRLLADGRLAIAPHPRHIEQLMKLTGIKATSKPKRVPGHAAIDEADDSEKLDDAEASEYRSGVGILLYLAIDLPHAQHAIRHLSTGMSSPTKQLKDILRHLVSFLFGTKDLQLCLDFRGDDVGLHNCYTQHGNEVHLEVYSDSDWGSNKQHRKSVSAGYICCGTALLYSSSRTQRVVALSSAEAEVYAASSTACDGILIGKLVAFCTGRNVVIHHLMDSAAARGILARQGVGRIRHLSCRILWLQQLVKQRSKVVPFTDTPELFHLVSGVSGSNNIADLGTKRLGKTRLAELMNFCNLGYIVGSTFAPFSEHVQETKQVVALIKSLKKKNFTVAGIIQASLIQNALSRCSAMSMSEGTMDGTSGMTIGYVGFFTGHFSNFGSILFVSFEIQVWQMGLLICLMIGIVAWTINEVLGYKASLSSWSALTDSMFEDDEDERREAFSRYRRWKKDQEEKTHWVSRNIRSWFAGDRSDFDRQAEGGAHADLPRSTGTQTPLEMPAVGSFMFGSTETESEKVARYRHLKMEEASDVELWMSLHHHDDMDDESSEDLEVPPHPYPEMHDMQRARTRAIRVYERRRQEAVDRNDLEALDALERSFEWLHYV